MRGKSAFTVEGRIVSLRSAGVADVELSNGHRLVAHVPRKERRQERLLAVGEVVTVELSPFDLSEGRIRFNTKLNHESSSIS